MSSPQNSITTAGFGLSAQTTDKIFELKKRIFFLKVAGALDCFKISPLSTFQTDTNFSDWIVGTDYEFGIIFLL